MAQMPSTGAPPQPEFRDLKELLSSYKQEVHWSEAQLKRTYEMLDNEAAHTAQECMDRYLLNSTLLARVFDGPEGARHCPGGITEFSGHKECLKAFSRDHLTPEMENFGRVSPEGRGGAYSEHDPVDDSAGVPDSTVGEVGCHSISVKGVDEMVGSELGAGHSATRKCKQRMIAPGVHRVELSELDEDLLPMGPDEETIFL